MLDNVFLQSGHYSSQFIDIINRMVDPDPAKRPTAAEVASTANKFLSIHQIKH